MICFQILSLYSITTQMYLLVMRSWLWFAFRFYLCIQSQRKTITMLNRFSCDLLSDFIFVFNHNWGGMICSIRTVVICFQILSLYSITTDNDGMKIIDMLWFAFRFYLCIQSQHKGLRHLHFSSCDLLSDFIFVFNHNQLVGTYIYQ